MTARVYSIPTELTLRECRVVLFLNSRQIRDEQRDSSKTKECLESEVVTHEKEDWIRSLVPERRIKKRPATYEHRWENAKATRDTD